MEWLGDGGRRRGRRRGGGGEGEGGWETVRDCIYIDIDIDIVDVAECILLWCMLLAAQIYNI